MRLKEHVYSYINIMGLPHSKKSKLLQKKLYLLAIVKNQFTDIMQYYNGTYLRPPNYIS